MYRCRAVFRLSTARPTFSSQFRACGEVMIDILVQLAHGFVHCLTPLNMAMLVTGIVIGLLIGVLPGLTLVMGVALALPFTYKMDVTASIVLLTAMYVSGTYGGAFRSEVMIDILVQLAHGFVHCLTPLNMAMLVTGIVIGLLIGVLPGLTLVMGVALALPFTYKMDVTASIVLLTAMYVSGTYGGAF